MQREILDLDAEWPRGLVEVEDRQPGASRRNGVQPRPAGVPQALESEAAGLDGAFQALSIGAWLPGEEDALEAGVARIPTGWERLDSALGGGLAVPSLNLLGAAPKSGKSTWARIIAERHAEAGGLAYYLDLENGKRRFRRQLLCRRAGLGPKDAARVLATQRAGVFASREEAERWRDAKDWLRDTLGVGLFAEFVPPHDFVARVKDARRVAGHRKLLVVVDSLQKLPGDLQERRAVIDQWVRLFERLRYECEATFLIISEIKRNPRGFYEAHEAAFKESGGIEYAADLAMTLTRPTAADVEPGEDEAPSTLRVELARDCEEDPRGEVASYRAVRPFYGLEELDPVAIRAPGRKGPKPTKTDAAAQWLEQLLADGPVRVSEAIHRGRGAGHSESSLQRAKRGLGLSLCTLDLKNAWRLP